jgi:hyperosmotically inducible protein
LTAVIASIFSVAMAFATLMLFNATPPQGTAARGASHPHLANGPTAAPRAAANRFTDAWITAKVKWFFVGEEALTGSDINVDTVDGVVTLKGTVKTAGGKTRAVSLAKNTEGVRRVVDQLVVSNTE